jgi:hypothetical protein
MSGRKFKIVSVDSDSVPVTVECTGISVLVDYDYGYTFLKPEEERDFAREYNLAHGPMFYSIAGADGVKCKKVVVQSKIGHHFYRRYDLGDDSDILKCTYVEDVESGLCS